MSQTQDIELFQKLLVGFCQEEDPLRACRLFFCAQFVLVTFAEDRTLLK